jgi:sucrose phosphorylase
MRVVLDEFAPHVLLLTETNVPHQENLSYFGDGSNEAQLVYNFALPPLVLHALLRGDASVLSQWAGTLKTPSNHCAFLNFLASHDGIGLNPARGILPETEINRLVERTQAHGGLVSYKHNPDGTSSPYELNISWFDALNAPTGQETVETQVDRFLVSQAIMLALPGIPAVYFHSLVGSRNDRAAADATGIPRRINRAKLRRVDLERDLADPATLRARVFARYTELLRLRRSCGAFHPQGEQEVMRLDPRVFAIRRVSPDGTESRLCLHNVTSDKVIINTGRSGRVELLAYQTSWLKGLCINNIRY